MRFWLYKLLDPLTIMAGLCIWSFFSKTVHRKAYRIALLLLFLVFSNPLLINTLIAHHESEYLPLRSADPTISYNILVLGAGKNDDNRLSGNQRLSEQALARLVEGVKWMKKLPYSKLIGSGPKETGDLSQAQLMAETATMLGIEPSRIFVQEDVHNTRTEAESYVRQFGTKTPLILCTSALHIPRAVKWFRACGVQEVIAAPAQYEAPHSNMGWNAWVPSCSCFDKWQAYLKEVIGIMVV